MSTNEPASGNSRVTGTAVSTVRLKPREATFLANYLAGMNGSDAARAAGFSEGNAANAAWRLLHRNEAVMQAVKESQLKIREQGEVTASSMMAQLAEDRRIAIEQKNAMACVRASEVQAKLAGLLIDRQDVRAVHGITVQIQRFGDGDA